MILAPPAPLREWRPELPPGDLRAVSLHWTGGDYEAVFPAYHFCIAGAVEPVVHHTHELRDNMRDLRADPDGRYAAHTRGRNSWSIGLAIAAMRDATPADFGAFPLTEPQVDALCRVAARLATFYRIALGAIRTHAEAALEDGYFGAGEEERWDIARLRAAPDALVPKEARAVGELLRARIAEAMGEATGG